MMSVEVAPRPMLGGRQMGHHLNLTHLSEDECEQILKVIQRDFDLRQTEKQRLRCDLRMEDPNETWTSYLDLTRKLSEQQERLQTCLQVTKIKINEVVSTEEEKAVILAKEKTFNENCCMRCFARFFFIFNQKVQCVNCQYFVCKSCAEYDSEEKEYVCKVCIKQQELHMQTCDWFYTGVKQKFKRFGSAKVVRSLYKRKTDSDSENDSGYHPAQYSSCSLPVGKKSRPNILGLFEMEPNCRDGDTIMEERDTEQDVTTGKRLEQLYHTPYTCPVATGQEGFQEVKDTELQLFRSELSNVALSIKQMLEKQSPEGAPLNDDDQQAYERMLDNHRRNISCQLSSLSQSLHIAIDNQSAPESSLTARHQMVQEVINDCIQHFVGHKVEVAEDKVSDDDDESQSKDGDSSKPYEDLLADAIVNNVAGEIVRMRSVVSQEETDVRTAFTQLSNLATISQLSQLMSESETDTDNPLSLDTSQLDDTVSDIDSHVMDQHELSVITKDVDGGNHQMPLLSTESGVYMDEENGSHSRHSGSPSDDDSLDDVVKSNLIEEQWRQVESKTSSFHPPGETTREEETVEDDGTNDVTPADVDDADVASASLNDDDKTPIDDSDDGTLDGRDSAGNDLDDEFLFLDCVRNHHVPLPSFEAGDDTLSHTGLDLDDIISGGENSTAEEEEKAEDEEESEEEDEDEEDEEGSGDNNWSLNGRSLFKNISAYDNFGKKKVGRDYVEPVFMLIPNSDEFIMSPRIGDRDADEMSDLSDDMSLEGIDDSDSGHQELPVEVATEKGTEASTPVVEPLMIPVSTESEETDPKFVVRPTDVTCIEGESVTFECEVTGTEPIDVFWYRTMAEVQQLDDDEHYDISLVNGRCTLEMFSPVKSDSGQYLCIGVNELGQCSQSFQLTVADNTLESKAPEFLKPLHDVETYIGHTVKFRCKVKGYPHPKVLWFKDGKRLKPSDVVKMEKIGNRDYILAFDYVSLDEDAEYMAIAKNLAGEARSSAQLIVNLPPTEEAQLESPRVHEHRTMSETSEGCHSSQSSAIYPDTEDLLKVALQMSDTRGQITETAENVLVSADGGGRYFRDPTFWDDMQKYWKDVCKTWLSAIHRHLDEMDEKLDTMQSEVFLPHGAQADADDDDTNNNSAVCDDSLLRDYDDMMASAASVRSVTGSALDVLTSASQMAGTDQGMNDPKTVILKKAPPVSSSEQDEEVELHLSYPEFERLFEAGLMSKLQLSRGKVKRSELARIHQFLQGNGQREVRSAVSSTLSVPDKQPKSVDCGLKRVDSKRYKRDYVINRDAANGRRSKWQVRTPSAEGTEIIRSTSSEPGEGALSDAEEQEEGDRTEEPMLKTVHEKTDTPRHCDTDGTDIEIYVTASKTYTLEERIKQLEAKVEQTDDNTSPRKMSALEDEVTQVIAETTQHQQKVEEIEVKVAELQEGEAPEEDWRRALASPNKKQFRLPRNSPWRSSADTTSPSPKSPSESKLMKEFQFDDTTTETQRLEPQRHMVVTQRTSLSLTGETTEESIPACRAEADDTLEMPSVKNLLSKFRRAESEPPEANVNRVYSLTGRDLPKTIREKLKRDHATPGTTPDSSRPRRHLDEIFQDDAVTDTSDYGAAAPPAPPTTAPPVRDIIPEPSGATWTPKEEETVTSSAKWTPSTREDTPTASSVKRTSTSPRPQAAASEGEHMSPKRVKESLSASKPGRNSAIMARAAFWDSRISEGKASDKEVPIEKFPELSKDMFKSADEVFY